MLKHIPFLKDCIQTIGYWIIFPFEIALECYPEEPHQSPLFFSLLSNTFNYLQDDLEEVFYHYYEDDGEIYLD
jgi:hypothetical protein